MGRREDIDFTQLCCFCDIPNDRLASSYTGYSVIRDRWNDSKRGITSGFVVSGFAAGAFILNQAITAILNPNNDSPTLESSSGERYFQQTDILDRVPAIFWMLGSVYASMQLIGVLLLKRPKLKKKEQIITVSMTVSLAERQSHLQRKQRASSRLEAINAMNKLDDSIERRVSELSVANSDGSYEVLPATTINISKEGTYENVSSSRRNSLDSDDDNNYNTVHSTYSTTTIVPYELQSEHDNPSFVPDYEVDGSMADLDGNKRGVGDGGDNSDDDDFNDGGTFGNLRSSPTISRKPKKKKSVCINEASDENNPETTSVTTENINTSNSITTHDTLANNINTNTTETDGDPIDMVPMGKKRRFSGVAEKDIETMSSGVAPHKVHFDISADQRRRPSTAERLVLEFRRLSRRLSVPEFVFRNIFGKSNSRRERIMRPLRLFKTKTFYKLWFIFVLNGQGIAFMLTLWKAYGQTFINDDFFLSTVGACSSLFNAFGRITWGIVADKFTFRVSMMSLSTLFAVFTLTLNVTELLGKPLFFIWMCFINFGFAGNYALLPFASSRAVAHICVAAPGAVFSAMTVSSAIGAVLTVELKETIGWDGMFFLTGGLSIIVILIAFTFDAETPSGDKI
ncbi:uncharacterized protein LOC115210562 [Octopus sinensis]|uniref:Uncharacterized protein LOC115210562 n=1 Tax=Octopus sinensis TaxID=2607531 RepID=A0A6P7S9L3_9MOLL|nr:uncharacterized protein LOC115210562 [Octopus sinensis]